LFEPGRVCISPKGSLFLRDPPVCSSYSRFNLVLLVLGLKLFLLCCFSSPCRFFIIVPSHSPSRSFCRPLRADSRKGERLQAGAGAPLPSYCHVFPQPASYVMPVSVLPSLFSPLPPQVENPINETQCPHLPNFFSHWPLLSSFYSAKNALVTELPVILFVSTSGLFFLRHLWIRVYSDLHISPAESSSSSEHLRSLLLMTFMFAARTVPSSRHFLIPHP